MCMLRKSGFTILGGTIIVALDNHEAILIFFFFFEAYEETLFSSTLQSSLPDTSIEGSVREKSTLQARFSCSSYSSTL